MNHRMTRLLVVACVALVGLTSGCGNGTFGEEFQAYLNTTAQETAVAIGTFVVERAVDAAFQ
jgi:hypothetical protein